MFVRVTLATAAGRAPTPGRSARLALRTALASERRTPQRIDLTAAIAYSLRNCLRLSGNRSRLPGELQTCVVGDPFEQVGVHASAHQRSCHRRVLAETG